MMLLLLPMPWLLRQLLLWSKLLRQK